MTLLLKKDTSDIQELVLFRRKNRYRSYSSYAKCPTITPGLVGHLGLSMELSFISNHAELVSTLNRRAKLFTLHSKHVLLRV